MERGRERRLVNRSRLIELVVHELLFQRVVLAEEVHEVQRVGLLDHVEAEDLDVGPVLVDRDLI